MFTGIINLITSAVYNASTHELVISLPDHLLSQVSIGDSISVSGVCLTVISIKSQLCYFYILQETCGVTTFKDFPPCRDVNIELAMRYNDFVGGHLIQGHVHRVGIVDSMVEVDRSYDLTIDIGEGVTLIYKDSITIDGVSLTIASVSFNLIRVSLIPHTLKMTTLSSLVKGDLCNLEFNNTQQSLTDNDYMAIAIEEGDKGQVSCIQCENLNPCVGCVIVLNNVIIGRGFHAGKGTPHAEAVAINSVKNVKGATLFTTLSPCDHKGYTDPCTQLIIESGISHVVIGYIDPDKVSGNGVDTLTNAGIIVRHIDDEDIINRITDQLRYYIHSRSLNRIRPYCTLKIALSVDGCYLGRESARKITSEDACIAHSHDLRAKSNAIMVGANTMQKDNPQLNIRYGSYVGTCNPDILVMGGNSLKNECGGRVFRGTVSDVLSAVDGDYHHVLIEGGNRLHVSALNEGVVDEIIIYRSSNILSGLNWTPPPLNLQLVEQLKFENETMCRYRVIYCKEAMDISYVKEWTPIDQCLSIFAAGGTVLVMDDEDRENEGDLMCLAETMSLNQMISVMNDTTGMVCVAMDATHAKMLDLPPMVKNNTDLFQTAFTVSVDHVKTRTGVSAADKLITVNGLGNPNGKSLDFNRPGHIFPLIAHRDGLFARRGHTEAAVALAILTDSVRSVAIAELKNMNGTMKRYPECKEYALNNNIPIVSIGQIAEYYSINSGTRQVSKCNIRLKYGESEWKMKCFTSSKKDCSIVTFSYGNCKEGITPVRIHSECFTGDVMGSLHCDCGKQLKLAMKYIVSHEHGIIIFPAMHEGRGIGLSEKVNAYMIQQKNKTSTYDANIKLGHSEDARCYDDIRQVLKCLEIVKIKLLTENPDKINGLKEITESTKSLKPEANKYNTKYLECKKRKFASGKRVLIVSADWYMDDIDEIVKIITGNLNELKVTNIDRITVPGSNEIPFLCKKRGGGYDAIIAVGIIVKGDTLHFENISTAVSNGLMSVQLELGIPVINCILSCLTREQVDERIHGEKSTLSYIAETAIRMSEL